LLLLASGLATSAAARLSQTGAFSCAGLGTPSANATATSSAASIKTIAASTSSTLAPSATSLSSCPTDISAGSYQFPILIIPTSPEEGDHSFGNSSEAFISPINSTLFNFDIPYTGTCSLLFLFPYASSLDPSAGTYYFSGIEEELGEEGGLDFALLAGIANASTTYNTTPQVTKDYGKTVIIPGNNYTIATFSCSSGQSVTYSATSIANVELDYFQDKRPSPIGLYVVPCS